MRSVLVTGATGFIGRNLMPRLISGRFEVLTHERAQGDIARNELSLPAVDHVVHLAGRSFVPDSWREPREFYATNVLGTVNVLEYCRRTGASLTFLSSYLYGIPKELPVTEDHPVSALNPYAHSKLLAEQACGFYRDSFGVACSIVRLFNLYGPGQPEHYLISSLVKQANDASCHELVVEDDTPRRDYIHVDDFCELLVRMAEAQRSGIFNAASGASFSVAEIAAFVSERSGKPVRSGERRRPNEIPDTRASIERARETFGWEPRIGLFEGIQRLLAQPHRS